METVVHDTSVCLPSKVDTRGLVNPYTFKFNDKFMQKETAPNYYPPLVRKQMNEYMTKTSIRLDQATRIREQGNHTTTSQIREKSDE